MQILPGAETYEPNSCTAGQGLGTLFPNPKIRSRVHKSQMLLMEFRFNIIP
jgi:hypothetical protein